MPSKVLWNSAKLSWKKYDINYSHGYTMFASTNLARTQVTLNRWSTADQDWQEYDQIKKLSRKQNAT